MSDGRTLDDEAFTKILTISLMGEYLFVSSARAAMLGFAAAFPALAGLAFTAAAWILLCIIAMNLATLAAAYGARSDPENGRHARSSLVMTGAASVLIAVSFASSSIAFHLVAVVLTAGLIAAVLAFTPGKLPPPSD